MTDPIADMLTRIKNAYLARKVTVMVPSSKVKESLAAVLIADGYIEKVEKQDKKPQAELILTLRYVGKRPSMTDVKRISKPGRRLYTTAVQLPRTLGGYGSTIVSTSQGLMNDKQARAKNLGGELICKIW
jgi:small subunit ribosomal protein S8